MKRKDNLMPKKHVDRINDTLEYLTANNLDPDNLTRLDANARIQILSPLISIGGFRGFFKNPVKTQQRRALRALILTYLTRLNLPRNEVDALKHDFAQVSESTIRSQIAWAVQHANTTDGQARTNAAASALAATAAFPGVTGNGVDFNKWDFFNHTAGGAVNCYGAVLYWLFTGGAFSHRSLRSLMDNQTQANINQFVLAGNDPAALPQLNAGNAAGLHAGRIICLYTRGDPFAHMIMSVGGGNFVSNNTPLVRTAPNEANNLFDTLGVFTGINQAYLHTYKPVIFTFLQLQHIIPITGGGGYLGYAILEPLYTPWEGKHIWRR